MKFPSFNLFLFIILMLTLGTESESQAMLRLDSDPQKATADSAANTARSEIRLAGIFQDGALLQREMPIPVWGHTTPGTRIKATFDGRTAHAVANTIDGYFLLRFPAHPAAEGLEMTFENLDTGVTHKVSNLAVGEVYIAAGQSNMAFQLRHCKGGKEAVQESADTGLRFYQVTINTYVGEQRDCPGKWLPSNPENSGKFSGAAYFFARKLRDELKVPVGILSVSYGGVNIESWISRADLMMHPEYADELLACDTKASAPEEFREDGSIYSIGDKMNLGFKRLFPNPPAPAGENPAEAAPDFDDSAWQQLPLPASWTLTGHNHAGIFWFRREIFIPENTDLSGQWKLGLGAVDKADETYVNGQKIGATGDGMQFEYWNQPRSYQVPAGLLKHGRNVIAVRAVSMVSIAADGGLIGPADKMLLTGKNFTVSLTGNWRYKEVADYGTIGMTFMRSLGSGDHNTFHSIYDNAIRPLAPYALRGAIFYQGEANAICMAHTYEALLETMIQCWRRTWAQPQFHFFTFQLPEFGVSRSYAAYSQWARIREAQLNATAKCGGDLVVTTGYGDTDDIHPINKKPVSEFAALMAKARIDGNPHPICRLASVERSGDQVKLTFSAPVRAAAGTAPLSGFVIAGKDAVPYRAAAALENGAVIISAPQVREPAYIWYNWSDHPDMENQLLDAMGMPVSPFRCAVEPNTSVPVDALPAGGIPVL